MKFFKEKKKEAQDPVIEELERIVVVAPRKMRREVATLGIVLAGLTVAVLSSEDMFEFRIQSTTEANIEHNLVLTADELREHNQQYIVDGRNPESKIRRFRIGDDDYMLNSKAHVLQSADHTIDIYKIAARKKIPLQVIEAMLVASSSFNPNIDYAPESYRGAILMDPEDAGMTPEPLGEDPELAITVAAARYRQISRTEPDTARAIAIFYAGEKAVAAAMAKTRADAEEIGKKKYYNRTSHAHTKLDKEFDELNWVDNIENEWQRSAIYITLQLMEDDEQLSNFYCRLF